MPPLTPAAAHTAHKQLSLQQAQAWAEALRARGQRVVLANGAFDLLHVGHVRYLQAAAKLGDALIVAVNADCSVRAAKGPARPIVPESERAEIVAALACVACVVVFRESTASEVIRAVRPHVQAKGTDYTAENVAERPLVEALGGTVEIVGDAKHHSTSATVHALQAGAGHRASTGILS